MKGTIQDLRGLLDEHAESVPPTSGFATQVRARAHAVRIRRRIVSGAVAASLVAVTFPIASQLTQDPNRISFANAVDSEGVPWVESLEGLDLPLGPALDVPFILNGKVIDGDEEIPAHGATDITVVPGGVLLLTQSHEDGGDEPGRLVLVRSDGTEEELDTGFIVGNAPATRLADQTLVVAYTWQESATSDAAVIRVRDLEDGHLIRSIPMDNHPAALESAEAGSVSAYDVDGSQMLVDLTSGETTVLNDRDGGSTIGRTAGGLVVYTTSSGCIGAATVGGQSQWEKCDQPPVVGELGLSPDGHVIVTNERALDADTGDVLTTFDLPQLPYELSEWDVFPYRLHLVGWENSQSVIFKISTYGGLTPDDGGQGGTEIYTSWVDVRCPVGSGKCERIPSPAERMGLFAD